MAENIYQELADCDTREDYLRELFDQHNIAPDFGNTMAELLGEEEDFDGLVTWCQDHEGAGK